jgi:malonate-semialdehyde dehydrogenase (acetylating)/methylmalonate-semialdehyde dehydrogenase
MVDVAAESAVAVFPAWRGHRRWNAPGFLRHGQLVEENSRICQSVTREQRRWPSARQRLPSIENIEYACGVRRCSWATPENLAQCGLRDVAPAAGRRALITPFNFPAMVPMGCSSGHRLRKHFRPETERKVPLTVVMIVERSKKGSAQRRAQSRAVARVRDALLTHPKVRAISFVGSSPSRNTFRNRNEPRQTRQANGGARITS